MGNPGRWVDDRPGLRSPVYGKSNGQPDSAMVHIQLAGDLARDLDGDADDARHSRANHYDGSSAARERRVRNVLAERAEPYRHRRQLRGALLHIEPVLIVAGSFVDGRQS